MSLLRVLAREYLIQRLARGRRPPRRRGGFFVVPQRRGYYGAPMRRTRVRVGGCCLPIPLGVVVSLGAGTRLALRRRGG